MAITPKAVIDIAEAEVGYLEKSKYSYKQNPMILYDKTQGAGSDNYTKYGKEMHDLYPQIMDFPAYWCDAFVDWCFYKAYGIATAKSLLCGNFDDYTISSASMYNRHGALGRTPRVGSQIFFSRNNQISGIHHTGLVVEVTPTHITTIEGNTSSNQAVIRNGGCVAKKQYTRDSLNNTAFYGYPPYDTWELIPASSPTSINKDTETIAREVIAGRWGTGSERRDRLTKAGYDYPLIQRQVNLILNPPNPNEYKVKVTTNALNIRSKATASSGIKGTIRDRGTYTIVETSANGHWGRLKSGAGWICLDYTTRI